MSTSTAGPPCPKCQLPTVRHCSNILASCNWLKCVKCHMTIGPRRALYDNGKPAP